MVNADEYILAQKIMRLLSLNSRIEMFDLFHEIYEFISEHNFSGSDLYIILENMLDGRSVGDFDLCDFLDEMFLEFSWYNIDKLCNRIGMGRYACWNRFTDVVYCLKPVLFHLSKEKEFFGYWNCVTMTWNKQL